MKFGLITEFWPQFNNLGDHVQSMAIEHLYSLMGVDERDIQHIGIRDLASYDGERLLLPWNYAPVCIPVDEGGNIHMSERITPVFLGFTLSYLDWGRKFVSVEHFMEACGGREFLMRHAPIGCRDENTRLLLHNRGIPAYLQGCITSIFPMREPGEYTKVMLADCNAELLPHMPHELLRNAEVINNEVFAGDMPGMEMYRSVKERYAYFRDNAALMVSGRFHIVTPCYAMGIPSILIERKEPFDFGIMVNPEIRYYPYEEFRNIDWHPGYKDIARTKTAIVELAKARLETAFVLEASTKVISEFYQQATEQPAVGGISIKDWDEFRVKQFVLAHYAGTRAGRYFIWGAKKEYCHYGVCSFEVFIGAVNKDLQFAGWVDTFKTGSLCGKPIITPDCFLQEFSDGDFIIVIADKAIGDALRLFKGMGLADDRFLICAPVRNIEERDMPAENA